MCWAERGGLEGSVGGMVVGLLVFGLGISPLAVVVRLPFPTRSTTCAEVADAFSPHFFFFLCLAPRTNGLLLLLLTVLSARVNHPRRKS